ncbi:phage N-6-adenine-methyltransferase [uncultured Pantoea sp.]|uniref:phage N-6-adenine-methyltransferase n=1 Tax=uncultured Pantoea sp. TaxID=218084 RepID=UPI0025F583EA|nr:phage N-6-adenine-methyltransferase [uncultured Pantoea sp.]
MTCHTINPYCAALEALRAQPTHQLKQVGDQWRSPDRLWWGINSMFGPFVLDLFADRDNAKCEAFYSAEDNALTQNWSCRLAELNGAAFANPPYSRASQHEGQYITGMRQIMAYTLAMREAGGRYVFLIKAATAEVWWPEDADHIAFVRGRVSFDLPVWYRPAAGQPSESSAGFGAAIAVFDKTWRGPKFDYISRDHLEARGAALMAQIESAARRMLPQAEECGDVSPQVTDVPAVEEQEIPLMKADIIAQSGFDVWACAAAAFGDKLEYTFSESKFAHVWANDSVTDPQIALVSEDIVTKAIAIIESSASDALLTAWVELNIEEDSRTESFERLQRVAEEFAVGMPDFIHTIEQLDRGALSNIRVLRATLRATFPETQNDVWPAEAMLIADQVHELSSLPENHRRKVMHHINRMLLERQQSDEIIASALSLTATFGEHAQ